VQPLATPYGPREPYRSNFFSAAYIRSSIDLVVQEARGRTSFFEFIAALPENSYPNLTSAGITLKLGQASLKERLVIAVAEFDGPEETYGIRNQILSELQANFTSEGNIEFIAISNVITVEQGSANARALGEENNANMVIWGWYRPTENPNITIHIENLNPDRLIPLETSTVVRPSTTLSDLKSFTIQQQLGQEISALVSFLAGYIQYQDGNYSSAFTYLSRTLELEREGTLSVVADETVYFYRAGSNLALANYQQAIADYDQAIQINPTYVDAYINRGITYNAIGEYERAIGDFDKAIEIDPSNPEAYLKRAESYRLLGLTEQAIADLRRALELNTSDLAGAYFNLGLAYAAQANNNAAIDQFTQAIAISPEYADPYYYRGLSYQDIGKTDEANADFARYRELTGKEQP
jgi:tetratricopeptide (TPR) repeat protein